MRYIHHHEDPSSKQQTQQRYDTKTTLRYISNKFNETQKIAHPPPYSIIVFIFHPRVLLVRDASIISYFVDVSLSTSRRFA